MSTFWLVLTTSSLKTILKLRVYIRIRVRVRVSSPLNVSFVSSNFSKQMRSFRDSRSPKLMYLCSVFYYFQVFLGDPCDLPSIHVFLFLIGSVS